MENSSSILFRGLRRWTQLWDEAWRRVPIEERGKLGLVKYSPELAFLFRRMVEAHDCKESQPKQYLARRVTYDPGYLYEFIRQVC